MGKDIHLYQYRDHKNLVANLNKKEEKKFLYSLTIGNESKPFSETFTFRTKNKGIKTSGNIMLSDKEDLF